MSQELFNIYMKPFGVIIRSFAAWCHRYTDETQFYFSITFESGVAVKFLDWCLNAVVDRMKPNILSLNFWRMVALLQCMWLNPLVYPALM